MFLGIDSGQTALKVMVFDDDGLEVVRARRPTQTIQPQPRHVERNACGVVDQLVDAIAEAVAATPGGGSAIEGIGIVAHGDGMYLIDSEGNPTRNAILALDTRAQPILDRWNADGTIQRATAFTAQDPFAASLAPLLAWLQVNEPETLERTRWALYCKDWLRFALTGEIATDFVEANSSVGNVWGTAYSVEGLREYGLSGLQRLLPPPRSSSEIGGRLRPSIAERTGLRPGTPVAIGTHDVVAAAFGAGATEVGDYSMLAGTYSVNQYISAERTVDWRWQARPWIEGGRWVFMAASPASATNFEWFMNNLMKDTPDPIAAANADVASIPDGDEIPFYHPFLYGSPFGGHPSASFVGLRGWHTRGHLIKSAWEGVVHNHRTHMDWLDLRCRRRETVSLAGGASQSAIWSQMFADALDSRIDVARAREPGALGAAMLAAISCGRFKDTLEARDAWVRVEKGYTPRPEEVARWNSTHARYNAILEALKPVWDIVEDGRS